MPASPADDTTVVPAPPPASSRTVTCPACSHPIDNHRRHNGYLEADDGRFCLCAWAPNDIAYHLFAGGLTPLPTHELQGPRR